ncbi:MAG: DUF2442 domain-containing protein [bacterium]|nr:DUF2442 domain-containing protein [bacterium]
MKSETVGRSTFQVEILNISKHGFWIFISSQEYFLPFENFPWFKEATVSAILNVELLHANHLHWPDLDVDLELDSIRSPEKYPLIYK